MTPSTNVRIRVAALVLLGLIALGSLVWLFWPSSHRGPAAGTGDGAVGEQAGDAALPSADLAPPKDAAAPAPDQRARAMNQRVSDAELRRKVRRHGGLIRACYHRAVRKGVHQVPRRIRVELELAAGGRVKSAKVMGSLGPQLQACLRRSLLGWRFSRNARAQQLRFPIVLAR